MAGADLQKHDGSDEHAEVAPRSGVPVRYNPDAPSEAWGWHGEWRLFASKGSRILLAVFTAVILLMLFGNHVSHVEDWYLILFGVGMIVWIASREASARKARRRRP